MDGRRKTAEAPGPRVENTVRNKTRDDRRTSATSHRCSPGLASASSGRRHMACSYRLVPDPVDHGRSGGRTHTPPSRPYVPWPSADRRNRVQRRVLRSCNSMSRRHGRKSDRCLSFTDLAGSLLTDRLPLGHQVTAVAAQLGQERDTVPRPADSCGFPQRGSRFGAPPKSGDPGRCFPRNRGRPDDRFFRRLRGPSDAELIAAVRDGDTAAAPMIALTIGTLIRSADGSLVVRSGYRGRPIVRLVAQRDRRRDASGEHPSIRAPRR